MEVPNTVPGVPKGVAIWQILVLSLPGALEKPLNLDCLLYHPSYYMYYGPVAPVLHVLWYYACDVLQVSLQRPRDGHTHIHT